MSCEDPQDPIVELDKEITISEVQDYFETELNDSESGRNKRRPQILWQKGRYKSTEIGEAIVLPLSYDKKASVSGDEDFQGADLETASFIFVYKDQKKIQLEVVEFVPRTSNPLFTGHITVRDWKGKLKRFFEMDNGELVTEKAEVSNERGSFICTSTYYWYCTEHEGNDTCELDHVDIDCVNTSPPGGPVPLDEYLDAGPSGGGGLTSCPPGHTRDTNGICVPVNTECPVGQEKVNGDCLPVCPAGFRRDKGAISCSPIVPCATGDDILDSSGEIFKTIWALSNAGNTSIAMEDRLEQGGWIINNNGIYSFQSYPAIWMRQPCSISPPINWINDIPANAIAAIHSHPFYFGEDRRSICGEENVDDSYSGGPSGDDYWFVNEVSLHLGNYQFKGYVLDGDIVTKYDLWALAGIKNYDRCGY